MVNFAFVSAFNSSLKNVDRKVLIFRRILSMLSNVDLLSFLFDFNLHVLLLCLVCSVLVKAAVSAV